MIILSPRYLSGLRYLAESLAKRLSREGIASKMVFYDLGGFFLTDSFNRVIGGNRAVFIGSAIPPFLKAVSKWRIRGIAYTFIEGIITNLSLDLKRLFEERFYIFAPNRHVKGLLESNGFRVDDVDEPMIAYPATSDEYVTIARSMLRERPCATYLSWFYPRKNVELYLKLRDIYAKYTGCSDVSFYLFTSVDAEVDGEGVYRVLSMIKNELLNAVIIESDMYIHLAGAGGLEIPPILSQMLGIPTLVLNASPMRDYCMEDYCYRVPIAETIRIHDTVRYQILDVAVPDLASLVRAIQLVKTKYIDPLSGTLVRRLKPSRILTLSERGFEKIVDEVRAWL